jgi:hypothetical protein
MVRLQLLLRGTCCTWPAIIAALAYVPLRRRSDSSRPHLSAVRPALMQKLIALQCDPSASQTALIRRPAPSREPGSSRMAFQPPHRALSRSTRKIAHQRRRHNTWIGAALLEPVQLEYCRSSGRLRPFVGMPTTHDAPSAPDASLPHANPRRTAACSRRRKPQPEGRLRTEWHAAKLHNVSFGLRPVR